MPVETSDDTAVDRSEDVSSQGNEVKSEVLIDDNDGKSALSTDESPTYVILPTKQARLICKSQTNF